MCHGLLSKTTCTYWDKYEYLSGKLRVHCWYPSMSKFAKTVLNFSV